jgi:hypothetical protein
MEKYRKTRPPPISAAVAKRSIVPAAVASLALAVALASLALPLEPTFDPWAWLIWGREVVSLDLDTSGGPSWKPLPVILTSAFAPAGDAAPELWLVVVRFAWLLVPVLAYRLGARLDGSVAGGTAAVGVLLIDDPASPWLRHFAHGLSEPIAVAATLGTIERHLAGRRGWALGLTLVVALLRPEAWPFLLAYAFWLWRSDRALRAATAAVVCLVPLLWLVPDLLGSGDALTGGVRARVDASAGGLAEAGIRVERVLSGGYELLPPAVWASAAVGLAVALWRSGRRTVRSLEGRTTITLALAAAAWFAAVAVETVVGYAGLARFMLPAVAVVAVIGGVGVAGVIRTGFRRHGRLGLPARAAGVLLAAWIAAAGAVRLAAVPEEAEVAAARSADQVALRTAVDRAGGAVLGRCGPVGVSDSLLAPPLAWELGVPLGQVHGLSPRVGFGPRPAGVLAVRRLTALSAILGAAPDARAMAGTGRWAVFAIGCSAAGQPSTSGADIAGVLGGSR